MFQFHICLLIKAKFPNLVSNYFNSEFTLNIVILTVSCVDPEGGTRGPDPPWNLKILPKKR